MSGPKDNSLYLERARQAEIRRRQEEERRRRIEAARQEELRRQCEEEARRRRVEAARNLIKKKINENVSAVTFGTKKAEELQALYGTYDEAVPQLLKQILQTLSKVNQDSQKIMAITSSEDESALNQAANNLTNLNKQIPDLEQLDNLRQELTKTYCNKLSQNISELSALVRQQDENARLKKEQEQQLRCKREAEEAAKIIQQQQLEEQEKTKLFNQIMDRLADLATNLVRTNTAAELEELRQKIMTHSGKDLHFLKDLLVIDLEPKIKHIEEANQKDQELLQRQNEVKIEYETLCQELNLPVKNFPLAEESCLFMQSEIVRMRELSAHRLCESYIRQSIDEVMVEMGYNLIGRAPLDNDGIISHKLYKFNQGTAISVTIDTDGDICMELGGLDETDREPDAREAIALKADMEEFCPKYQELKARLLKKGVKLSTNYELPPEVEYAQIFNINDFDLPNEAYDEILGTSNKTKSTSSQTLNQKTLD